MITGAVGPKPDASGAEIKPQVPPQFWANMLMNQTDLKNALMRLRRLLAQMRLRDVLGCIFVVGFALYAFHTLFWIVDDIRLKNLDFENEVKNPLNECPSVGQGTQGLIITAPVSQGSLPDTIWRYLSVWALARKQGAFPAVPERSLQVLQETFANLTVPTVEDYAVRCNASHLPEELEAAGPKGTRSALARKAAYGRKRVELVVVGELLLENELMHEWVNLARMIPFKRSLRERSRRELESAAAYVEDLGYHRRIEFVGLLMVEGAENVTSFFTQAMAMMRFRLTGLGAPLFIVVCEDPEWCSRHIKGDNVHLTDYTPDNPLALSLLAACNHSIFPFSPAGLTAAAYTKYGSNFVYHFGNEQRRQSMLRFIGHLKPPWFQLSFE